MKVHACTIALMFIFACLNTSAQQLFKCGATFQDKPCDSEVQKKYSPLTGSFTKEQVTANADTQCAELGSRAVPIIQSRANNETLQSLHAQVDSKPIGRQEKIRDKELITTIFSKKGSTAEIRGAIETDCMEKKWAGRTSHTTSSSSPYPMSDGRTAAAAARAAAIAARRDKY